MSCDIVCEEVGTTSFVGNRILWTIPKFYDLEKNIRFKSPQFSLMGSTWQLRYCYFRSTLNSKEWLDIGVKLLSKIPFECNKVRFGIIGKNLEISKTLESNDVPKYHSLTVPYEDEMTELIPEGNFCLFFMIDNQEEAYTADTYLNVAITDDEDFANENSFVEASTQTEDEIEKETSQIKDGNMFVEISTQTDDTGSWKLPEDFENFLLKGHVSDIILKVGEEKFRSHRCILAARSSVFLEILTQHAQENNIHVMDIQDVDPNAFSVFLHYLYTGNMKNITSENNYKLYTIAMKYKVYELKKICLDHMLQNIIVENFCDLFTLSLLYEESDLIDACSQFFMENSLDIVVTSKWETFLSKNTAVGNGLYVRLLKMNKLKEIKN